MHKMQLPKSKKITFVSKQMPHLCNPWYINKPDKVLGVHLDLTKLITCIKHPFIMVNFEQ